MKRIIPRGFALCFSFVALAGFRKCSAGAAPAPAINIPANVSQLFIDDVLIESSHGLQRTLHQPVKENGGNKPILALDSEFAGHSSNLQANGTIIYDPRIKKYVMLALGMTSDRTVPTADRVRIYRFTSTDEMNWIKGDNGAPQRIAIDLLDQASGKSATNTDLFSFYYDTQDPKFPYKGWLYFANWGEGREGIYYVYSPDGVHWNRGREIMAELSRTIQQDGRTLVGIGDVTTFYHDDITNKFLASIKFYSRATVGNQNHLRSRTYLWLDRLDAPVDMNRISRVDLVPPAVDADGDLASDEYYASGGWRYQSLWLGELKVWHLSGDYPYSAAGSAFLKLIVSHDGLHWQKVQFKNDSGQPGIFIANGTEGRNDAQNDGGYITLFSQGPLRIGNDLVYYYGSSSYGKNHPPGLRLKGGGIFRARLRIDGFVSIDQGTLTTKPLHFSGDKLLVNSIGPVHLEVLDAENHFLGQADIEGDSINHPVMFGGQSLQQIAGTGPIRLRFTLDPQAHLYSFACQ